MCTSTSCMISLLLILYYVSFEMHSIDKVRNGYDDNNNNDSDNQSQ